MNRNTVIWLLLLMLLCACTDNEVVLVDYRQKEYLADDHEKQVGGEYIINFIPQVSNTTAYGGLSLKPFAKGNVAQIYVAIDKGQFLIWPYYRALSAGTLTPIEDPIIVPTGYYDLYFTSINTPEYPPVMIYSVVKPPANGIDYLWYMTREHVQTNNTNVPVVFEHKTAQIVVISKNSGPDQVVDWVDFAMLQVPDTTDVRWNLYTGDLAKYDSITNSYSPINSLLSSQTVMNSSGLLSTLSVLPLEYDGSLDLYLEMKMHDVTSSDSLSGFSVSLDIPDGKLLAGNAYYYTVNFETDTVYVGDVEINSWVEVDLDGNPLYPSIIYD